MLRLPFSQQRNLTSHAARAQGKGQPFFPCGCRAAAKADGSIQDADGESALHKAAAQVISALVYDFSLSLEAFSLSLPACTWLKELRRLQEVLKEGIKRVLHIQQYVANVFLKLVLITLKRS